MKKFHHQTWHCYSQTRISFSNNLSIFSSFVGVDADVDGDDGGIVLEFYEKTK